MAQYDRRILVPYLQDVCSIELLCTKITREIITVSNRIQGYNSIINRNIIDPQKPDYSDFEPKQDTWGDIAVVIWLVLFIGGGCFIAIWSFFLALIPWGIATIMIVGFASGSREEKKETYKRYNAAVLSYEKAIAKNSDARNAIPLYRSALQAEQLNRQRLQSRLDEVESLRTSLYDVNIIPKQYRNIYAAYYLYDYFSSCRENDLDKIIQTMLLDEIKQKLDKIIIQNEEILLNQRIQLALQEHQNQLTSEHHRKELTAIARMELNQERQLDYQNMIAQNQIVTNFLIAADYLYKR